MDALYIAFAVTWTLITAYIIYMIRTRSGLEHEIKRLGDRD